MPYKAKDAKRFTRKANTPRKQRQWKHVYDSAIRRGFSDARAIQTASGVVKRSSGRKGKRRTRRR